MTMPTAAERRVEGEPTSAGGALPAAAEPPRSKPLLRGVSHQVSFFVAIVATAALVRSAPSRAGALAALVFGATLVLLFGTSACYHRIDWTPRARARMRRLDHAAIFLLIAGGYTPLFSLVEAPGGGHGALSAIWAAASVGVVKSLLWPHAPKWLTAALCVAIGWMVVFQVVGRAPLVGAGCVALLVVSGVTYSVGALVYAAKRPDPSPRVFGYHEIFHLLVCLASAFLYAHVARVLAAVHD
jgi:hemolysin III